MPFDGQDPIRARLDILRQLCETNSDRRQSDWKTCLWSEARQNARLRQLGIPRDWRRAATFFGLNEHQAGDVFGASPKGAKLPVILATLARFDGREPAAVRRADRAALAAAITRADAAPSMSVAEIERICDHAAATAREIAAKLRPIRARA